MFNCSFKKNVSTDVSKNPLHQIISEHFEQTSPPTERGTDLHVGQVKSALFEILSLRENLPAKHWKSGAVLNEEQNERILSRVRDTLISTHSPWQPKEKNHSKVQRFVFEILRGRMPPLKEVLQEPRFLKAVIWKKDPEMLAEVRMMVNEILEDIATDLTKSDLTPEQTFHMEAIIGDLLAIYPYLRPENGAGLSVPVKVEGEWQLLKYNVENIQLTPGWMGSPIVAYGLNPQEKSSSPPILLFKGTTYPTDKGFMLSLLVDINPFASVGSYAFSIGKEKIKEWLDLHTKQGHKAPVFGKSLGGAQSWRTALHFPDQVAKVMAYGAPGFSSSDLKKVRELSNDPSAPEINIICQKNDPVPLLDRAAKRGVKYYELFSGTPQKGILAHAHMFSTHEASAIVRNETYHQSQKWQRITLSLLKALVSIITFPIFLSLYAIYNAVQQTAKLIEKAVSAAALYLKTEWQQSKKTSPS